MKKKGFFLKKPGIYKCFECRNWNSIKKQAIYILLISVFYINPTKRSEYNTHSYYYHHIFGNKPLPPSLLLVNSAVSESLLVPKTIQY